MAITDYASLQAEVAAYLHRADLTAVIPDFITLAEIEINADLRLKPMETALVLTTAAGTGTVALPADFAQMRLAYVVSGALITELGYLAPDNLRRLYRQASATGLPRRYSIEGANMVLGPVPDSAYAINGIYYTRLPALASGPNWLVQQAPSVYLYGALKQAAPFLGNDARLALWSQLYDQITAKLTMADQRGQHAGTLAVATDTGNP